MFLDLIIIDYVLIETFLGASVECEFNLCSDGTKDKFCFVQSFKLEV
jgi:hypothetical protein